jgi:5-(carboxyamino)imidazole ribonucleotide synthase
VQYEGAAECLAIPGVYLHLYGKAMTAPYRKMGHVTIVDDTIEKAIEKGKMVKGLLKVTAIT